MKKKLAVVVLVAGLAFATAAMFRTTTRADAAPGDCYADSKGPSEPTICN